MDQMSSSLSRKKVITSCLKSEGKLPSWFCNASLGCKLRRFTMRQETNRTKVIYLWQSALEFKSRSLVLWTRIPYTTGKVCLYVLQSTNLRVFFRSFAAVQATQQEWIMSHWNHWAGELLSWLSEITKLEKAISCLLSLCWKGLVLVVLVCGLVGWLWFVVICLVCGLFCLFLSINQD